MRGVRAIQYRDKSAGALQRLRFERARRRRELTRARGCTADRQRQRRDLAANSDADGVHIGRDDGDVADARRERYCTDSCLACPATTSLNARARGSQPVPTPIAFGSMFPSVTKPHAVRAPLSLLIGSARCVAATAHHCDRRHQCRKHRRRRGCGSRCGRGAGCNLWRREIRRPRPVSWYGDSMKDDANCRHDKQRTTV